VAGIVTLFTLMPAAGHLGLIALVRRYRLDDGRCDEIRAELSRRHAAATQP
jgi:Na+/melibiose symporter-like transporter